MAENLYFMGNFAAQTTGTPTVVNTLTSACVPLQLSVPSTRQFNIVEYGVSFNGSPSGVHVELRATSATTTAGTLVAGVILPYTNPGAPTSLSTSGTSNSLYATTMGAPATGTVSGYYDSQQLSSNTYIKQFPLAREPVAGVSTFVQIVVNSSVALGCTAYIIWRE